MTIDLTRLRDAGVRAAAKAVAERIPDIDNGLMQARRLGIVNAFTRMRPEPELQSLFEMADAAHDAAALQHLRAAISFSFKKSVTRWTESDGRDRVRAVQLFRALHDGPGSSYADIRARIMALPTAGADLRRLAREPQLPEFQDRTRYLDSHKLLKNADDADRHIEEHHLEWYLDQAALMAAYRQVEGTDPDTARRLAHTMLNSYGKAAPVAAGAGLGVQFQVSPLAGFGYHRSTSNKALTAATRALAERVGWTWPTAANHFKLLHNATFSEVLARVFETVPVATEGEFDDAVDRLLAGFRSANRDSFVAIDVSRLIVADPAVRSLTDVFPDAGSLSARLESRFLAKALAVMRTAVNDVVAPGRIEFEPEEAQPDPSGPAIESLLGDLGRFMARFVIVGMSRYPMPEPPPAAQALQAAVADAAAAPPPAAPVEECSQPPDTEKDVVTPFLAAVAEPAIAEEERPVDLVLFPPFLSGARLATWRDSEAKPAVEEILAAGGQPDPTLTAAATAGLKALVAAAGPKPGPPPEPSKAGLLLEKMDHAIVHTGYRPDPVQTKRIWAATTHPDDLLRSSSIVVAQLATSGQAVPTVCRDLRALLDEPVVAKFGQLAQREAPYLKVLAPATVALLKGLLDYRFVDRSRVLKLRARLEESRPQLRYPGTGTVRVTGLTPDSGRQTRAGPFLDRECTAAAGELSADALRSGTDLYLEGSAADDIELKLTLSDAGDDFEIGQPATIKPFGEPPPRDLADLDRAYWARGLKDLLQTTYFRLLNAMREAVHRADDLVAFLNQIELIHQEIAAFLAMLEPHGDDAFETALRERLASAPGGPFVPGAPRIHLKPSAMHCMASIAAGVEAMRGSNRIKACFLKDCYYEEAWAIEEWRSYRHSTLDGDDLTLNDRSLTDEAHTAADWGEAAPFDLFVCDIHHNISVDRTVYRPERLVEQVELLLARGLVADRFTIAIDCTIDLICSPDVRDFLTRFKPEIDAGRFNVVLFRSAQKFDMLGLDNYYGGYTISVCNPGPWAAYLARMDHPDDQLDDAPRQGLTHLVKYAARDLDAYRLALMTSTRALYDALPPAAIAEAADPGPLQVSKILDPRCVFLDIKFPGTEDEGVQAAFGGKLTGYAARHGIPLTQRASFGFPTSNYTTIRGIKVRLNPGLEDKATRDRFVTFFGQLHEQLMARKAELPDDPDLYGSRLVEILGEISLP